MATTTSTQTVALSTLHPESNTSATTSNGNFTSNPPQISDSESGLTLTFNPDLNTPQSQSTPASHFDPAFDAIIVESRLADSTCPDGGYGWVVIGACFVLTFWFVGASYSWGIIQAALVKKNLSTPATLSFVGSLWTAFIGFGALINARVIRKIGARPTALVGAGLLGAGMLLSGFATENIGALFFTVGVLMGSGTSLQFMVISTITTQYFNKKRGLANGIVYAGGGIGGAALSFAMDALLQKFGAPWTFRILSLVNLVTCLPASYLIKERAPIKNSGFVEWNLFKNLRFTTLFIATAIAVFPLFVPPFFLPLYSASLGLNPTVGAGLVAGFNFSSAIGRIGCGFLSDYAGPVNTLLLSLILSAVSMLVIWPVSNSIGPLILFVIVNGAGNGGFFSTVPTVVGTVFGSRRVSVAMGMVVTGWAGGYLMGAPIAGYILEAYGGQNSTLKAYHPAIFYAGSLSLVAGGLVLSLKLMINKRVLARL